jgi:hypothetical protein
VYAIASEEQADVPFESVAVAWKVVVEFVGTRAPKAKEPDAGAVPVTAAEPEQSGDVKSLTVAPAGAEPLILGLSSVFTGSIGVVLLNVGASGGNEFFPAPPQPESTAIKPSANRAIRYRTGEARALATIGGRGG